MSRLDEILDAHAAPKLPALEQGFRHFTREDWLAWSGCESEYPQIHERQGVVVLLDGATVGATIGADGGKRLLLFAREFSGEAVARSIARALASCPAPDLEFVEGMLGEAVGEV